MTTGLEARATPGLHDFLVRAVLPRLPTRRGRALDLGCGSGAFAARLGALGFDVLAVDRDLGRFGAALPAIRLDLDTPDFATDLGPGTFDLVTAVEVIEHLESPIGFLRNLARLPVAPGLAVVTTPNVDSAPARVKFLLSGKLRMLDERGDPTHISPIFADLMLRQYLPRAGLAPLRCLQYPPDGFRVSRPAFRWLFGAAARAAGGSTLLGDNHVFVLRRAALSTGESSRPVLPGVGAPRPLHPPARRGS